MRSPLRWLIDLMGDDDVEPDPDATVEAGRQVDVREPLRPNHGDKGACTKLVTS